jgi:hypothetical protein
MKVPNTLAQADQLLGTIIKVHPTMSARPFPTSKGGIISLEAGCAHTPFFLGSYMTPFATKV